MDSYYRSNLVSNLSPDQEDEWWARTAKSAKHLLTSICFREVAKSSYELTGSVLLSPVGFYYSVFHLSVAMLYMEYSTPRTDLRRLRHARLRSLIQERLINRHIVDRQYLDLFRDLQELREYANYVFGERVVAHDYFSTVQGAYDNTGNALDQGTQFILTVQTEVSRALGLIMPIQVQIGDGFGDDLIRGYLSDNDEERVRNYLFDKGLTT